MHLLFQVLNARHCSLASHPISPALQLHGPTTKELHLWGCKTTNEGSVHDHVDLGKSQPCEGPDLVQNPPLNRATQVWFNVDVEIKSFHVGSLVNERHELLVLSLEAFRHWIPADLGPNDNKA